MEPRINSSLGEEFVRVFCANEKHAVFRVCLFSHRRRLMGFLKNLKPFLHTPRPKKERTERFSLKNTPFASSIISPFYPKTMGAGTKRTNNSPVCTIKMGSLTLSFCLRDWRRLPRCPFGTRFRDSPECYPITVPNLAVTWEIYSFGWTKPSIFCNLHIALLVVYHITEKIRLSMIWKTKFHNILHFWRKFHPLIVGFFLLVVI